MTTARTGLLATTVAAALLAGGCFTRSETIVVREDGSAQVTYEAEGTAEEMAAASGLPGAAGWRLMSETVAGEAAAGGDADKVTRVWTRELQDLNTYPATFDGGTGESAALASRTTLMREEFPGRTVYTFTRRYVGRRAGKFAELEKEQGENGIVQRARTSGLADLTPAQRDELFTALAEYEAAAMWLRVRDALGRAVLEGLIGTDAYRAAVAQVKEFLQETLTGPYLSGYFARDEAAQERELERLRRDLGRDVGRLLPPSASGRLAELLAEEERRFQVTQDLGDDGFVLQVSLPGVVVASNALEQEQGTATWVFDGSALLEGDLVLEARSVLENGKSR